MLKLNFFQWSFLWGRATEDPHNQNFVGVRTPGRPRDRQLCGDRSIEDPHNQNVVGVRTPGPPRDRQLCRPVADSGATIPFIWRHGMKFWNVSKIGSSALCRIIKIIVQLLDSASSAYRLPHPLTYSIPDLFIKFIKSDSPRTNLLTLLICNGNMWCSLHILFKY